MQQPPGRAKGSSLLGSGRTWGVGDGGCLAVQDILCELSCLIFVWGRRLLYDHF